MGLAPISQTVADAVPMFAKVLEIFTGGFSLVSSTLRDGVTLPAGSLFRVDEATRQATPVKTAVMYGSAAPGQTALRVVSADWFKVGDRIGNSGGTASAITSIEATGGSYDVINIGTAFVSIVTASKKTVSLATGDVLIHTLVTGSAGTIATTANTISVTDVEVGDTNLSEGLAMLRRGTAYKNRLQGHLAGHLADIPATIQISNSY